MSTEPSKHTKIELTIEELKEILGAGSSGQVLANEDEIDLLELWKILVERKWLILSLTSIITLSVAIDSLIDSLLMTPKYESTVVVSPVFADSSAELLFKYGGLASISLSGGSEGVPLYQEALTILESHRFLAEFIEEKKLKPILFYKNWDSGLEKWVVAETSWLSGLKEVILGKPEKAVSSPGQEKLEGPEPSMQNAVNLFKQMLSISEDKETGLIKLKITWKNPVEAKIWANELIQKVDDELRHKAIAESKRVIDYIKVKLPTIELQNIRVIALNMIEEQVKKTTFARVNKEYVFKVIDPAIVAEKPVSPKRNLIVVVGFVLGLMFSVFVALILSWRKKSKNL